VPAPSDPPAAPDPAAPDPGDALVDVVDEAGDVTATVTRREIRAGNLLHRAVFVVVLDGADRVVVHQRADWKDVWPSRWDLAFGGVVDAGEGWTAAAARELLEEAGITAPLEHLGAGRYEDASVREVAEVYLARSDGPFTFPDGEVAASARVPLVDLGAWITGHDLVPDSLAIVVPLLPPPAGAAAGEPRR
jgi:8-oxo-dGTP pyrophosphatase MutT (NUDIX family)